MPCALCQHIKTDGIRCQSPALRDKPHCYYHSMYVRRASSSVDPAVDAKNLYRKALGQPLILGTEQQRHQYRLGPMEDAPAIQVAISTVLNALAANRMDLHRASTLLYGLQLATTNLRAIAATAPAAPTSPGTVTPSGTCAQVPETQEHAENAGETLQPQEELAGQRYPHPA